MLIIVQQRRPTLITSEAIGTLGSKKGKSIEYLIAAEIVMQHNARRHKLLGWWGVGGQRRPLMGNVDGRSPVPCMLACQSDPVKQVVPENARVVRVVAHLKQRRMR